MNVQLQTCLFGSAKCGVQHDPSVQGIAMAPGALAVRLTLLATVLYSVAARPVPGKLATPDYTLYHTK